MALTKTQVSQLYVSIFNRASEGAGNTFWQTGADSTAVANEMLATTDATTYFGTSLDSNQAFVEHIYLNTLNKTVTDDAAGIAYWVDLLDSGTSRGAVVAGLVDAVSQYATSTDATTKAAYDQFTNRVEVSNYMADTVSAAPSDYATSTSFKTSSNPTGALEVTNDDATVTTANLSISGLAVATYTLTTNTDLINGGTGNDTIDALVGTITATGALADTLQSVDIINGGAGTDTLNISLSTGAAAPGPKVENVENIMLTDYASVGLNATNFSGVTSFTNTGSISNTAITGVDEIWSINVKNVAGYNTAITTTGTTLGGTADEANITVENTTNDADITLTDATYDYETVNIASNGTVANRIDVGGTAVNGATKLVLTGAAALNIDDTDGTNAMTAIKTVDASAMTGALTASLISSATDINVTGGSGNDSVTIANVTKDDVVDLGDGTDKLTVNFAADTSITTAPSFKNVETLKIVAAGADVDVAMTLAGATSVTKLEIGVDDGTDGDSVGVTKAAAGLQTVAFNAGGVTTNATVDTVSFALATSSGTSDTLNLTYENKDTLGNAVVMTKDTNITSVVSANGIENMTITTSGLAADDSAVAGMDGGLVLTLSADKLTSLTVTADTYVDLDAAALDGALNMFDASATTSGVIVDLSLAEDDTTTTYASTSLTVKGGSGNDTITNYNGDVKTGIVSLGAGNDSFDMDASDFGDGATTVVDTLTIDAGSGNDTIDVSDSTTLVNEGTISVTLGDGVDTIKIKGVSASQTGVTVTDFVVGSGGDKIDLATNASAQFTLTSGYVETAGASTLDYGMTVYTGNDLASLAVADAATAFAAALLVDANTAGDKGYIIASDGTDTGVYEFIDAAGTTAIASGELVLILTLTGVSDASALVVDNFTDFLA